MGTISTTVVGTNAQSLAPAPVVGADADVVTVINLDTANTVSLGSSQTHLPLQLGPLASLTLTAPVCAKASTVPLEVGIIPGGANYSPGSLTITGPVTATITGPVEADVTGTVAISSGSVDATVSGTVDIAAGSVTFTNDQIDVTGIGGYVSPGATGQVYQTTSESIPFANSFSTPIGDMLAYQGYDLQLSAWNDAGGASSSALLAQVQLNWYADAAGDYLLYTECFWTWLATVSGGVQPAVGSGPCHARYLSVTIQNVGGYGNVHVTNLTLFGSGRTFATPQWRQAPPVHGSISSNGISYASWLNPSAAILPGFDGVLINQFSVTPSGSGAFWIPLPLFTGTVSCYYDTSAALTAGLTLCTAQQLLSGVVQAGPANSPVLWQPGNAGGTPYTATLNLPNAPCYIAGSATPSDTFTLVITGDPN